MYRGIKSKRVLNSKIEFFKNINVKGPHQHCSVALLTRDYLIQAVKLHPSLGMSYYMQMITREALLDATSFSRSSIKLKY